MNEIIADFAATLNIYRFHRSILIPIIVLMVGGLAPGAGILAQGPSFSCDPLRAGSIEQMICTDPQLAALDRTLAGVYAAASQKAANEHPPVLKAEQRGWIKGRNDCWKSDDKRRCVMQQYHRRIAELQARYRLLPGIGPVTYACDGNSANQVVATYFATDPPTLIAERGDRVSLMYLQPSANGAHYQGRNETIREQQDAARVIWGHGTPEIHCKLLSRVPQAFDTVYEMHGIRFHVMSTNDGSLNTLRIVPGGLEIDNTPIMRRIDGTVTGAEAADLDADGSPEIYVYVTSAGSGSYGSVVAYAANRRKSLSEIYLPPITEHIKAAKGYMGHDTFFVHENALLRRFPVYRDDDVNARPSGGIRLLIYKLVPGEAGWRLKLIDTGN